MDKEQLIKLGKAIEYMRDHYQSPIKVNEIAEYAGLTPKALNRIMSDKYGYTFAVLLRKYRLYQSLRLLHFDQVPTDIIALRCGFKPNYFFNEFKKEFQMTPKDMKEKTLFPDMPMFQNINGYPLSMEYKEVEEVTIEGYPVRIPKDEKLDLMWDAAYGFRHPNHRNNLECTERLWGLWWSDVKDRNHIHYLMGQKVNPKSLPHSEKTRVVMTGGKYAIFSVSRGKNYFDTANNVKEMVWHAYYSWKIFSEKEIDQNRIAFEMFDQEKAYYCVPLKAGYGGIDRKNDLTPYNKGHFLYHYITQKFTNQELSKLSDPKVNKKSIRKYEVEKRKMADVLAFTKQMKSIDLSQCDNINISSLIANALNQENQSLLDNPQMKMGSNVAFFRPEHSTEGKIFHLSKGYIVDKNIQCFEGCEKEIFSGGYYYIFSTKTDLNHLEEQIENMIPEVDYGWIKRNMLRTDFANRVCFYSFDGEKLQYYVPVIG